jgi:hypothetical protein
MSQSETQQPATQDARSDRGPTRDTRKAPDTRKAYAAPAVETVVPAVAELLGTCVVCTPTGCLEEPATNT